MKRILWVLFVACSPGLTFAQQRDLKKEYEDFRKQAVRTYSDFRDKANAEYAAFLKRAWQWYEAEPAIPSPVPDPPVQPVYVPDDRPLVPKPLPYDKVVPVRPDVVPPRPFVPIPDPQEPVRGNLEFDFFGAKCAVRLDAGNAVPLADNSEGSVSLAWQQLSDSSFNPLLQDCLRIREELRLCDWAYYCLAKRISAAYYGADDIDEAKVFQAYILTQSGYRVRMAHADGRLHLLLPSETIVYAARYTQIDGRRYYFLDKDFAGGGFHACNFAFPGEQNFSLYIKEQPLFPVNETSCRILTAARYPQTETMVCPNRNLIDFYDTYPQCRCDVHALASLSDHTKEKLYPVLKKVISGKTEAEAANILINFVQTAFEYQTDEEQFGRERPLFPDETLYYDYSDCEDRAILFSTLVRELLGKQVVLLHYPNHLATAVHFDDDVKGDYIELEGRRYIVCDPTFIGVDIGRTMPGMDNRTAEVIVLNN